MHMYLHTYINTRAILLKEKAHFNLMSVTSHEVTGASVIASSTTPKVPHDSFRSSMALT